MIKKGKSETVSHTFYVNDVVADAGTVTVTVLNADGDAIHSGSTIKLGNVYSFTLPSQSTLGVISIEWNGTIHDETTYDEIVGAHLFEVSELQALMTLRGLTKTYTPEILRAVRDEITETFETATNRGFVPRRRSELVSVRGGTAALSRVDVRQVVTVDGSSYSDDWTPDGVLTGLTGPTATVVYDYGLDVTADSRAAALALAVYVVGAKTNKTPANTESLTDGNGNTYRVTVAGIRGVLSPVPEVDVFLKNKAFQMPGVA
ncbi:hypothetical protein F4560_004426 [Saccharothrix ecbatanensis]|uniref:Uncharacterized protein n=1 Tax=Saccharothrix ecbatanensis TaxID=1105145 RepID=A0A7W9M287_9PSEU|nr:hypothetical protein [Saccharothrix ecbatanensis]MBB5804658.1 hypothetical protein [Saccharothrix ecbatanensis]